jgi:hypothetical protein
MSVFCRQNLDTAKEIWGYCEALTVSSYFEPAAGSMLPVLNTTVLVNLLVLKCASIEMSGTNTGPSIFAGWRGITSYSF